MNKGLRRAGLFAPRTPVLCFESTGSGFHLALMLFSGPVGTIETVFSFATEGKKDEDIVKQISAFIDTHKLKSVKALLVIPTHLIITKNIEVPSLDTAEIANIMNLQAARHTPYARDEIIIDYKINGVYRKSYTKILLVIVKKEVVCRQIDLIKSAGIETARVCIAPEAVGSLASRLLRFSGYDFPVVVLHLDTAFSSFSVVWKASMIFTRSIPVGKQHFTQDAARSASKFLDEVKKSLQVYKSEDIENTPQLLILLEKNAVFTDLLGPLNEATGLRCEYASLYERLVIADELKEKIQDPGTPPFLNTIAAAQEADSLKIDLIPEETKLKKQFEKKSREIIKAGVLSLSLFILVFVLLTSKVSFKNLYFEMLKEKASAVAKEAQGLENTFRKIQNARRYLAGRGRALEVLDVLYTSIPEKMMFTEVRFDVNARSLSVRGTADSLTAIYAFVESIGQVPYFKEVVRKGTTSRKEGVKEVQDFELAITLADTGAVFSREGEKPR